MSDFDKFFAEKLEEEGDFPHRDRNWKQLSQRLQAFEIGGGGQPSLWHYWPAAAAVVVSLTVAGWLLWKMQAVQAENVALRQEIAALRRSTMPPPVAPMATLPEKNAPAPAIAEKTISQPKERLESPTTPASTRPSSLKEQTRTSLANSSNATVPVLPTQKQENKVIEQPITPQPKLSSESITNLTLPPTTLVDSVNNQLPDTLSKLAVEIENKTVLPAETPLAAMTPDSLHTIPQDSGQVVLAAKDSAVVAVTSALPPDSVATATTPPPIIKPVRQSARFRVGVEAVAGKFLGAEPGISSLLGSGVTAAYSPLPFLRVTASADWLHFDVNTSDYVPQCHAPMHSPPMHTHPHDQLVQVESQQRQQHFALGLTYALPVHGWLRPAVRVAHNWVRIAPGLVSFKFEEPHGGPGPGPGPNHRDPDYVAQKFGSQTLSNIWRIGAGLEHELPRWTIGLWVDYSKSLATTESTFDALLVRGGVQYKFN